MKQRHLLGSSTPCCAIETIKRILHLSSFHAAKQIHIVCMQIKHVLLFLSFNWHSLHGRLRYFAYCQFDTILCWIMCLQCKANKWWCRSDCNIPSVDLNCSQIRCGTFTQAKPFQFKWNRMHHMIALLHRVWHYRSCYRVNMQFQCKCNTLQWSSHWCGATTTKKSQL